MKNTKKRMIPSQARQDGNGSRCGQIEGGSTNMNSINGLNAAPSGSLQQQVGISMLAKSLNSSEQQGAEIAQMLQQSVQPYLGGNLDIKV
jgi:hypothetical protein